MALLICAAVAPGLSVAQMVVRLGMPPTIPALLQSIAREWSMIPDHSCAWAGIGATTIKSATSQARRRITVQLRSGVFRPCGCGLYSFHLLLSKATALTRWGDGFDFDRGVRSMPLKPVNYRRP